MHLRTSGLHAILCAALVASAACGGAGAGAGPAQSPTAPATSESVPTPEGSVGPAIAPPGASGASSVPLGPAGAPVEMKMPIPSAMVDELKALGLDVKSLPPIGRLEPRTLRGVMKLFARSLGVKCGDCHQEGDFAAPTRRKKIAAHMWDDFVAKLSLSDGAPLFCDSCHQGRVQLLDRRDKKALSQWMDDAFVAKLVGKDAKATECETCHVDMDMHFLAKWGGTGG
jgi:hypothetical protein